MLWYCVDMIYIYILLQSVFIRQNFRAYFRQCTFLISIFLTLNHTFDAFFMLKCLKLYKISKQGCWKTSNLVKMDKKPCKLDKYWLTTSARVAEVEEPQDQWSTKGYDLHPDQCKCWFEVGNEFKTLMNCFCKADLQICLR